ncbi:hypothetical protein C0992_006464 [Termitomyces sp. T32_za158]|nr:hypothetical protein C0992_006464 [Termitomyces sp. T32_za158]
MKEYTSCYVLYDTAETWTATYEEWKAAVICLYPGAEESTCYTVNDLHQLVQDTFEDGIYTIGALSTYYQDFQRIAWWLLQNRKLYCNEERRLFQQGIPTSLWTKIACRLKIAKLNHHPLEPYDVKDVLEAGKWALKGTDTSITTFQERVDKWHRCNPNNIATATLTGNANPDAEQALQQQLIQEILPTAQLTVQPTTVHATLTWQEMINNLKQQLQALKNQTFDRVEIWQPKQVPKGYKPMANAAAPATAPPPATTSTTPSAPVPVPAPNTATPTASTDQPAPAQPPLHPYSGIPNCYAPSAQKNFAAPNKRQKGPY